MREFGQVKSEESPGLFQRLKSGLAKSTAGLADLFTKKKLDAATITELEEALVKSDMGSAQAHAIAQAVAKSRYDAEIGEGELRALLAGEIAHALSKIEKPLAIDAGKNPFVILVAGVNGTGKTTTIGKLASRFTREGHKVMLAAGDTFAPQRSNNCGLGGARQGGLRLDQAGWGRRGPGLQRPGEIPRRRCGHILIIDTAGRLQNKTD